MTVRGLGALSLPSRCGVLLGKNQDFGALLREVEVIDVNNPMPAVRCVGAFMLPQFVCDEGKLGRLVLNDHEPIGTGKEQRSISEIPPVSCASKATCEARLSRHDVEDEQLLLLLTPNR